MLLRTRITLMVGLGLALTAVGLIGAGLLRESLLEQRLVATAQQAQDVQWQQTLALQDRELDQLGDRLVERPDFLRAAEARDGAALHALLPGLGWQLGPGQPLQLLAVLGVARTPIVLGQEVDRALLDASSLERATVGEPVSGLRLVGGNRALVLTARRLPTEGEPLVLVLARDATAALRQLATRTGAQATLLDLRGRPLASTSDALWQAAAPHVALRTDRLSELALDGDDYDVSSLLVDNLAGQPVGTLVTLASQTPEARASQFLGRLALGGTLALLLAVLLGLNLHLRRSLRPLERSVDALQALAQGDTSVQLAASGSDDEVGRIAEAVDRLRATARELMAARALRERVRRRQERLLQSRLQQLAAATEQPFELAASASDEEQLRQLAAVMNRLTGQLIDQHRRLTAMVQELREALVTKTRLAGLEQELQIAAQVQQSILPRQPPQDARVELSCHITPAREVGGDFYDYFLIDSGHLGVVIADVSGKGVPAALFMTITRTLLKATAPFIPAPTRCIEQVNRLLAAENEPMMFVTLFYGVLELASGRLEYVNAGHNPPYLLQRGRIAPLARTGGMAVAIDTDVRYRSASVDLARGDQVFMFTDGVTEAFDVDGKAYGEARLQRALARLSAEPDSDARALGAGVVADVHAFERGAPRADDITCVVLRWRGAHPPDHRERSGKRAP